MEIIFVFLQAVLADLTTLQVIPLIQLSLFSKWKHLVSSTEPRGPSALGQAHPNVRRFASTYLDRKKTVCVLSTTGIQYCNECHGHFRLSREIFDAYLFPVELMEETQVVYH